MHQYGNYNNIYQSQYQPNFCYQETAYSTPFKTFVRNGTFSRNKPPQPNHIIIQTCIVCHLPIQANWMTTNIQVHGHCFQHIYGEAIQLQNDNNRLKVEVAELREQVENLKMKERINDFLGKNKTTVDPEESIIKVNERNNAKIRNFTPNDSGEQFSIPHWDTKPGNKNYDNRTVAYKVAVGNLPAEQLDTTRSVLRKAFSKFGTINKIWINPINKLYGYIEYEEKKCAENATQIMNGKSFLGKTLEVEMPFLSLFKESSQSANVSTESNRIDAFNDSINTTLSTVCNTKSTNTNGQGNFNSSEKKIDDSKEVHINDQEKKIKSLKLIVDSQKQVIMKYRNSLKNYADRSDYGTLTSNISLSKYSLTCSKESVIRAITNEMKEDISRIQENIRC